MPRQSGMADREPCPWRIVDDVGGAFCMGAIGGGIWHSIRGARLAPAGARMAGSMSAVQARSPVLGGQFAVWGGIFACCDCSLTAIRQKEDPWNSIISGAATGGILASRAGPRAMASAAVVGGVLLALIEGFGIMFTKMTAPAVPTRDDYEAAMRQDPTAPPTTGGMGMLQSVMGSSGAPPGVTAPPPQPADTASEQSFTDSSFSTESGPANNEVKQDGGGGWFGFGGGS